MRKTIAPTRSPRHDRRVAAPAVAVTGLAAVFLAGLTGVAAADPTAIAPGLASDLARLRTCESGGNYAINTGNGFYGAYQFDTGTWRGLGYAGMPQQAAPSTQDEAAATLQSQRGWQPWPGCTSKLGLGQGQTQNVSYTVPAAAPVRQPAAAPVGAGWDGHTMTTADIGTERGDVRAWQTRMQARGWDIAIDGLFGPQSSGVAARFAAEKGLHPAQPGTVDGSMFTGAWSIPVS